jgi:hypothetical protein
MEEEKQSLFRIRPKGIVAATYRPASSRRRCGAKNEAEGVKLKRRDYGW